MQIRAISTDRLRWLLTERLPPRIVDVRSKEEYDHFHIDDAVHIPFEELKGRAGEIDPMIDAVLVSEHGFRSYRACEWLAGRGYLKVVSLLGGVAEYRSPIV